MSGMEHLDQGAELEADSLRIEEWTLLGLGYGHCLDTPVAEGDVRGRNFLDAYGDSPHRGETEDLLEGFKDMDPTDPDYVSTRTYVMGFLEAKFGPPAPTSQP